MMFAWAVIGFVTIASLFSSGRLFLRVFGRVQKES
jgi:hypothetical protein